LVPPPIYPSREQKLDDLNHPAFWSRMKRLEDLPELLVHVMSSLLGGDGLGREVDKNVAITDWFAAESLQSLFPQLLGLLASQ
jgi:hypothetical protein